MAHFVHIHTGSHLSSYVQLNFSTVAALHEVLKNSWISYEKQIQRAAKSGSHKNASGDTHIACDESRDLVMQYNYSMEACPNLSIVSSLCLCANNMS